MNDFLFGLNNETTKEEHINYNGKVTKGAEKFFKVKPYDINLSSDAKALIVKNRKGK